MRPAAARRGRPRKAGPAAGSRHGRSPGAGEIDRGARPTRQSTTARSRSESMGGLVTCAKAWRRRSVTGRSVRASAGVGVSSPMLQSGSWPSMTIVRMSSRNRSASSPAGTCGPRPSGRARSGHGPIRERPARLQAGPRSTRAGELSGFDLAWQIRRPAVLDDEHLARAQTPTPDGARCGASKAPASEAADDEPTTLMA